MGKPASGPSVIADPEDASLGPKMLACNVSQRRFVLAALEFPHGKDWQIAKAAGYSDRSHNALRVTAHRLFHDEKVLAALHEEAGKRLRSSAVLGVSVLAKIARTEGHKDQLRAAEALLNRIGFHETSEHKVTVEHALDKRELDALAVRLAQEAGIDPRRLLGVNSDLPMIEGELVANEQAADA
jgi:phage terminase small subunit